VVGKKRIDGGYKKKKGLKELLLKPSYSIKKALLHEAKARNPSARSDYLSLFTAKGRIDIVWIFSYFPPGNG
jgi:hypothetical protein